MAVAPTAGGVVPVGAARGRAPWVRRNEPAIVTILSIVVFLALWQGLAMFGNLGPSLFAGPGPTFGALVHLAQTGELAHHLAATGTEFFGGFAVAAVAGVVLGLLLGTSEELEAIFGPYLMALYAAPRVAFISLLLVWFGVGLSSKIALVFLAAFFPIALNTLTGARNVDRVLIRTAHSYGATRAQTFRKVIVPFSVPSIMAGLRLGVGRALIGAFVAEMFGGTAGIGYLIIGAGSAGSVLANRISAKPENRVLVLEAGPMDGWWNWKIHMPAAFAYPLADDKINWYYHTEPEPGMDGRSMYCPRGRVLGGFHNTLSTMMRVPGHRPMRATARPKSARSTVLAIIRSAFQPLQICRVRLGSLFPSCQLTSSGETPVSNSPRNNRS